MPRPGSGRVAPAVIRLTKVPAEYTRSTLLELHESFGLNASSLLASKFVPAGSSSNGPPTSVVTLSYADEVTASAAVDVLNGQPVATRAGETLVLGAHLIASSGSRVPFKPSDRSKSPPPGRRAPGRDRDARSRSPAGLRSRSGSARRAGPPPRRDSPSPGPRPERPLAGGPPPRRNGSPPDSRPSSESRSRSSDSRKGGKKGGGKGKGDKGKYSHSDEDDYDYRGKGRWGGGKRKGPYDDDRWYGKGKGKHDDKGKGKDDDWKGKGKDKGKGKGKDDNGAADEEVTGRIYVNNVPSDMNENALKKKFSAYGEVLGLHVISGRRGTNSCIIRFSSPDGAVNAMRELKDKLDIRHAKPNPKWDNK